MIMQATKQTAVQGWLPIGDDDNRFTGTFDGQKHTITGLFIYRPSTNFVGTFGYIDGGEVHNIAVIDADVNGNSTIGGLVGYNYGKVSNSHVTGTVNGGSWVGGLVGSNRYIVDNSHSMGYVNGESQVGGLVGWNAWGTVENSYATGSVSGDERIGGLVGHNSLNVLNSYATGNVTGNMWVGGLLGVNRIAMVENSYATGSVRGDERAGGLVGYNSLSELSNSYSTGTITRKSGSTETDFGGFVGLNKQGRIINCYSTGNVHYEGATDPTSKGFAGSVVTDGDYEMTSNFWDVGSSGQEGTSGDATGITTNEMIEFTTFKDAMWDIVGVSDLDTRDDDYIWNIVDTDTRPFLSWQEEVEEVTHDHEYNDEVPLDDDDNGDDDSPALGILMFVITIILASVFHMNKNKCEKEPSDNEKPVAEESAPENNRLFG